MARKPRVGSVSELVVYVDEQLQRFSELPAADDLRAKVKFLVQIRHGVDDLGVSVAVARGYDGRAARERIRQYLCEYVGQVIDGDEIAVVSGISEYARRIRELRVETGYSILTGASNDPEEGIELKPDQYILISDKPDTDAARRWHMVNRIRKEHIGSKAKLLKYFIENVEKVLTTEELRYVADASEFGRRIRELRTEEGYAIATMFTGRPDLSMGEYVLLSVDRVAEQHDRQIPHGVQKEVYARDNNACRLCSWDFGKFSRNDPRILELHHLRHHAVKGENVRENLIVICSKCHDRVHAEELEIPFDTAE